MPRPRNMQTAQYMLNIVHANITVKHVAPCTKYRLLYQNGKNNDCQCLQVEACFALSYFNEAFDLS